MNDFRSAIQTDARFITQPSFESVDAGAIAGGFLFLFFIFVLIASFLKHQAQLEETQIEKDREFLERIWEANSNLEH
jgi:hypothetical protein